MRVVQSVSKYLTCGIFPSTNQPEHDGKFAISRQCSGQEGSSAAEFPLLQVAFLQKRLYSGACGWPQACCNRFEDEMTCDLADGCCLSTADILRILVSGDTHSAASMVIMSHHWRPVNTATRDDASRADQESSKQGIVLLLGRMCLLSVQDEPVSVRDFLDSSPG